MADERGALSILALVWVFLIVLFGMGVLELTWRSHTLNALQDTADFAAEAGTRFRESYVRAEINRYREEPYDEWVCEELPDGTEDCRWETFYRIVRDTPVLTAKDDEMEEDWRKLFSCGNNPRTGWVCQGVPNIVAPEYQNRWVVFTSAEQMALNTFDWNWTNKPSAQVLSVHATPIGGDRTVTVMTEIRMRPLYFKWLPTKTFWVRGHAIAQLEPLEFR